MNVLFICTGNTCRSPMAEGYARTVLGLDADSCGLAADVGTPAADNAVAVAQEHGVDLTSHHSKPLTKAAVERADRIFVMSPAHALVLGNLFPDANQKIRVLNIADPFGGDLSVYRRTWDQITAALENETWN